jgi:hypothetical protein
MVWAALVVPTGRDANVKLAGETTIAGRQRMHCPAAGKPISNSAKGAMELSKYRRSFCVRFILILLDLVGSIDHSRKTCRTTATRRTTVVPLLYRR